MEQQREDNKRQMEYLEKRLEQQGEDSKRQLEQQDEDNKKHLEHQREIISLLRDKLKTNPIASSTTSSI